MIVGRSGETMLYTYDGPVHLVTEIDGVRVISSFTHEMIQKVPSVVQKIFRINSTDAASYLLEASKQFQKKSHKADSYMDLIKDKLDPAVTDCITAASHEFAFNTQKLLMRVSVKSKSNNNNKITLEIFLIKSCPTFTEIKYEILKTQVILE